MSDKKFNVGDKVKYIGKNHIDYPEYYPTIGTIGKITGVLNDDPDCYIQWPKNSTSGNDEHWCSTDDIELVENVDMTNEEIWEMLKPKFNKNNLEGLYVRIDRYGYIKEDVYNAIAIAYRSGYERAIKGRPFKFGEKKKKEPMEYQSLAFKGKDGKWHLAPQPNLLENSFFTKNKSGHWVPVDPNNLPKEGTKVKLKKEYCNYYGGVVEPGEIGIVFHDASYVTRVLGYGINFGKYKTVFLPLDSNIIANCLDMWVEDDE